MDETASSHYYFEEIVSLYINRTNDLRKKYSYLRRLFERLCKQLTSEEPFAFSNLFSRLDFLCERERMDAQMAGRIRLFRIRANRVCSKKIAPSESQWNEDVWSVLDVTAFFFHCTLPAFLEKQLPTRSISTIETMRPVTFHRRIRVRFLHRKNRVWWVNVENEARMQPVEVVVDSDAFDGTAALLWNGAQLNLLNVNVDDSGRLHPEIVVLESDFLLNVTTLAECYKEYGASPLNNLLAKLRPVSESRYILQGNAVNLFLDELIYHQDATSYETCIKKAFRTYPFEFSTCQELNVPESERDFFTNARIYFQHIRRIVQQFSEDANLSLTPDKVVLEPSFVCEALGIQGRLDLMLQDYSAFVELKSGRAEDDWRTNSFKRSKPNHYVQISLYLAILEFCVGMPHRRVKSYLFYSRYPALVHEKLSWEYVKQVIDLRNKIVAQEYLIQWHNSIEYTDRVISSLTADTLNEYHRTDRFWNDYLRRDIDDFQQALNKLSPLERAYFMRVYTFITKEHYINQIGDVDFETNRGITYLWNASIDEKVAAGELYYDLKMIENRAAEEEHTVTLQIPDYPDHYLPNFREGDVVVLYVRNTDDDKVTNRSVFKAALEKLEEKTIKLRLRNRQKNKNVLPCDTLYAVEHDYMDITFMSMFRALHYFLHADPDRRTLLLGERMPRFKALPLPAETSEEDTLRIVEKAFSAEDYFLLSGPPGTGKTSRAMRGMIERFLKESKGNLLLLSYTNRAVDEMCKVLHDIDGKPAYLRMGSELSCDASCRSSLLENKLKTCHTRREVRALLASHRIVVGTVASMAMHMAVFSLKSFDMALIDEASQILEPHLLGLLTVKNRAGESAIRRFVMIGDHKQLPAVVVQSAKESSVTHPLLNARGITNLSVSLFERFYRYNVARKNNAAYDMLHVQGRMHPLVAAFANHYFYADKLAIVPLPHQSEMLDIEYDIGNSLEILLGTERLGFIESRKTPLLSSFKSNEFEARVVVTLCKTLHRMYEKNGRSFDPASTVGIITPYRSQIALIKRHLSETKIEQLMQITVDTVERYQGGQRDVIFYSCCVNNSFQLVNLVNNVEEDGVSIDRKLNVALTRARKQLFLTGVSSLLSHNATYARLIEFLSAKGAYVVTEIERFEEGDF